jgi:CubicO group peptidase (beta-lactamase class C family)
MLPALRPQVTSAPGHDAAERSGAYGYGFNVGVAATGAPEISHSGAFLLGAGTHFRIQPGAGIGIVILSNAAPVGAVEAIGAEFMEVVQFGDASRDWFAAYHAAMAGLFDPVGDLAGQERPAGAEAPGDLAAFAGRYDSAYFGAAEIARGGMGSSSSSAPPAGACRCALGTATPSRLRRAARTLPRARSPRSASSARGRR